MHPQYRVNVKYAIISALFLRRVSLLYLTDKITENSGIQMITQNR